MCVFHPSPNFTPGWDRPPLGIIIHWTAGKFTPSVEWLCNKEAQASAHWIVDYTGRSMQLVSAQNRAWHAGKSSTKYGEGCNNYTFGIELVGPPSRLKLAGWDMRQLEEAAKICHILKSRFDSICFITDHSTISPRRKIDVKGGEGLDLFPWDQFVKMTGIADYEG